MTKLYPLLKNKTMFFKKKPLTADSGGRSGKASTAEEVLTALTTLTTYHGGAQRNKGFDSRGKDPERKANKI